MFCPQCGNNLGTEKTCSRCGWSEGSRIADDSVLPAQTPMDERPEEAEGGEPFAAAPAAYGGYAGAGTGGSATPGVTVGKIRAMLASPLMLALCILSSVSAAFSLVSGRVNIFAILYAIAFWISYAAAHGMDAEMKPGGLKMVYYVSKALMIVAWVVIGLLAAGVVITSLCAMFGASIPSLRIFGRGINLFPGLGSAYGVAYGIAFPFDIAALSASLFFVLISIALLVACVLLIIIQIFYFRSLSKFSRSLYNAALNGRGVLVKEKAVRLWSFVLGIFSCASIFGVGYDLAQNLAALSGVCGGAAMIVCSVMIKKFLAETIFDTNM